MTLRRLSVFAGALLGLGLVVAPVAPAAACACGGAAPPSGTEVAVNEEHAIISWDGGIQRIDLLLGVLSSSSETGLVFPTPSPATVSLGDLADFEALDRVTTPRVVEEYDWWSFGGFGVGDSAGAPPQVLDRVQLGPIEAVTLAASDAEGLELWLAENGYELAPAVSDLLAGYVERGWYFVALKLTGDVPLEGDLDPLRFTFETEEPVYPMELSRAAELPQTVRLYVFGDSRQDVVFTDGSTPYSADTTWSGPVVGTEVESFGDHLTVVELYFPDPATQIVGDLAFTDSSEPAEVGTVRTETVEIGFLGIPLGWLLSGVALVGTFVALVVISSVGAKRS